MSVRFQESVSDSVAVVKIVLFVNSSRSISMKMDVNPPNPSEMEVETMNPCTAGQKRFRRLLNEFTYLCVVTALGKRADVVLQAVAQLCGEKSQIIPACGERSTHDRGRQEGLSSHSPGSKLVGLGRAERRESSEGMGLGGTGDGGPSELVRAPNE